MIILFVGIHVLACLFLIFVVLLQSAQAADLAGAFGGGGSQTALGMRSATTVLQKATTVAAVVFMVTSLALGIMGGGDGASVIEGLEDPNAPAVMSPDETPAGDEGDEQGAASEDDGGGTGGTEESGEQGDEAQNGADGGAGDQESDGN